MKNIRHHVKTFSTAAVALTMLALLLAGAVRTAQAQTFTSLYTFLGPNGSPPGGYPNGLVQSTNGFLYGTGGENNGGVFKVSTTGALTALHTFDPAGGSDPDGEANLAGLVQATNGNFYGTSQENSGGCSLGSGACGVAYKITPSGVFTVIHNFCDDSVSGVCVDGINPQTTMIQASNGDLYGTTSSGGAYNEGSLFKISTGGALTTLHSFCANGGYEDCPDGTGPYSVLVQGTDGNLYGTTLYGGANFFDGTAFKITTGGTFTTLHSFSADGDLGYYPRGGLVQAANGKFYGVTAGGGTTGGGTFFSMTTSGKVTTLYSFCTVGNCTDGTSPNSVVLGSDGNFYGTTAGCGANDVNLGTIFKVTQSGTLTTLHSFDGADGVGGTLMQDTDGTFYGTSPSGGAGYPSCNDCAGTVWSLSMDLGAFVETLPSSGKVGASIKILGINLTGATSVTFHGKGATFKVASSSEITTNVPTGATTGTVKVVTPKGTFKSNVAFQVP
jgi:uncharacterized repeat protein (TIGR03803 family)